MIETEKIRKLLFLDCDGVINIVSDSYVTSKTREGLFEPHLVERLNYLCRRCEDIHFVISSTWRGDMEELKKELLLAGFNHIEKISDRTTLSPFLNSRGQQIHKWLNDNNIEPNISHEVIIVDDEVYDITPYFPAPNVSVIHISPETGITHEDIKNILK